MITFLSIAGSALSMVLNWLMAQGRFRAVYRLGIVNSVLFIALNVLLACRGHTSMLLLTAPSAWAIVMFAVGLRRLNAKPEAKLQSVADVDLEKLRLSMLSSIGPQA